MRYLRNPVLLSCLSAALVATACTESEDDGEFSDDVGQTGDTATDPLAGNVFEEVLRGPISAHFGTTTPVIEEQIANETSYIFDVTEGPMCMRGAPFRVATRETESEELVIFLQGGGLCTKDFCFAVDITAPGVPKIDILDPELAENPIPDWDVVYVPYCDGSLFAGNSDIDNNRDGTPERTHRGLQNISAALDVAASTFPNPSRVVLAGSSGGGYGSIMTTLLVRAKYPDVPLYVFNDSGSGIARAAEPDYVRRIIDEFQAWDFVPASCPECATNGHLTDLFAWQLERDPNLKISVFSSYADDVISNLFLKIGEAGFKPALQSEMARIHGLFPTRFNQFLIEGKTHTSLIGDVSGVVGAAAGSLEGAAESFHIGSLETVRSGDITMGQWLGWMLAGDPRWQPVVE